VHHDGTGHAAHVHEGVRFSGTYYAACPPGAAALELYDTRRAKPFTFWSAKCLK
jgi:hypothetical protein